MWLIRAHLFCHLSDSACPPALLLSCLVTLSRDIPSVSVASLGWCGRRMSHRQGEEMTRTLLAPSDRTRARLTTLSSKGSRMLGRRRTRPPRSTIATSTYHRSKALKIGPASRAWGWRPCEGSSAPFAPVSRSEDHRRLWGPDDQDFEDPTSWSPSV